jgi:hypothetical protein
VRECGVRECGVNIVCEWVCESVGGVGCGYDIVWIVYECIPNSE